MVPTQPHRGGVHFQNAGKTAGDLHPQLAMAMRTKTVQRFYCDHCSKGMFRKADMAKHEITCIVNPSRACWLCESGTGTIDYKALADEFKKQPGVDYDDKHDTYECKSTEAINWLYNKVDGCPACVLAVLKQGKVFSFEVFNYREHLAEWHREKNAGIGISP